MAIQIRTRKLHRSKIILEEQVKLRTQQIENQNKILEGANREILNQKSGELAIVKVKDNGIGISEADQIQIFDKFQQVVDPSRGRPPGTGLGLNITRTLTEMQGGQIWFESEYGKGTSFQFTVPVAELDLE